LLFRYPSQSDFWRPLIGDAIQFNSPNQQKNYYTQNIDVSASRRAMAANRVMDMLGNVPGLGSFDFFYIALVMCGMMVIVGPIDWIVLKKLGRQPWTWTTTAGWIALITLGAMYIGSMFKSGDLHFRTLRLIDQADGMCIADTDAIGIYSPRTGEY